MIQVIDKKDDKKDEKKDEKEGEKIVDSADPTGVTCSSELCVGRFSEEVGLPDTRDCLPGGDCLPGDWAGRWILVRNANTTNATR